MNNGMNEIIDMQSTSEQKNKFTMKVLFGPMFGCEIHLPADDYFLIINPGVALQNDYDKLFSNTQHAAVYTQNTLYLPCDMPSPNLILRLSHPAEDDCTFVRYCIEIQNEDKCYNLFLKENEIFVHNHIRLAIKRSEDEWQENIRNFVLYPTVNAELETQSTNQKSSKKRRYLLIVGFMILVFMLIIAAVIWYKKLEPNQQILNLNDALAGAPAPLKIVSGRDESSIYVLATKYQALEWAQEALLKLHKNNMVVTPIWLPKYKKVVTDQLNKAGYPVLQVDFKEPRNPVIALWQDISPQNLDKLNAVALKNIPFALDIRTTVKTKTQLLQDARQGLDRLNVNYRQINTALGYALVVRDALSDTIISALQDFTEDFNNQWGNNIINITINLDEDWLQNKSYLDATNGYLFLNPRHWYFPLKQGDLNGKTNHNF